VKLHEYLPNCSFVVLFLKLQIAIVPAMYTYLWNLPRIFRSTFVPLMVNDFHTLSLDINVLYLYNTEHCKTVYEYSKQIFPDMKLRGHIPKFPTFVFRGRFISSHAQFLFWEYINRIFLAVYLCSVAWEVKARNNLRTFTSMENFGNTSRIQHEYTNTTRLEINPFLCVFYFVNIYLAFRLSSLLWRTFGAGSRLLIS
jgi:hypothetical protein